MSLYEVQEPDDWYGVKVEVPCINELLFDLDDGMKQEIQKVNGECDLRVSVFALHILKNNELDELTQNFRRNLSF